MRDESHFSNRGHNSDRSKRKAHTHEKRTKILGFYRWCFLWFFLKNWWALVSSSSNLFQTNGIIDVFYKAHDSRQSALGFSKKRTKIMCQKVLIFFENWKWNFKSPCSDRQIAPRLRDRSWPVEFSCKRHDQLLGWRHFWPCTMWGSWETMGNMGEPWVQLFNRKIYQDAPRLLTLLPQQIWLDVVSKHWLPATCGKYEFVFLIWDRNRRKWLNHIPTS